MRSALLALSFIAATTTTGWAQDDSPLFGSEGAGVIQISMPDAKANTQKQASLSENLSCTSQSCPHTQKAAMAATGEGQ